ncbi:MAG: DUF4124 domain-containing protein [Desulfuromonadales bacterium]|nr:DUF4124 domain-containing protein [Desulfuromonadales bacterium]MBN2793587.1 DUF4124 domain-containing protein [Desulfuromonadales bacterium]
MRILLGLFLMGFGFLTCVQAQTYSCRDSKGQLHITDNLQALPEECRGKTRAIEPRTPDNLNFVPSAQSPQGSGAEFEKDVLEVERAQQQRKDKVDEYVRRAAQLAEDYRQAEREKRQATRSWSYKSRDIIRQADERIEKARLEKKQLLKEMQGVRIPREQEKKIHADLEMIGD